MSHLFEELGALVLDADHMAHEALAVGSPVYSKIAALFPEALSSSPPKACGDDDRKIDRKKLAGIVFKDEKRRKDLEEIIHPFVRRRMEEEIAEAEEAVVVLEIPLLFEADFGWLCDKTIVVSAPQDVIEKRLQEKGFEAQDIRARLAAQMPLKEKEKRADLVIDNSQSLKELKQQVVKIWKEISDKR